MLWPGRQWLWSPQLLWACGLSVEHWTWNVLVLWQHLDSQGMGTARASNAGHSQTWSRATQRRAAVSPDMALSLQLLLCTWLHRMSSAFRLAICPLHKTERLPWSNRIWGFKAEINTARDLKIPFLNLLNLTLCTIGRTRCVLAGVEFISLNLTHWF